MNQLPAEERTQTVVVRKEAATDERYGCRPEVRSVEQLLQYGIINLNKPEGPTSHLTADYLKKIFNAEKVGHSGTLDPGVTGVLPIALNRATRVVQCLLPAGKEYVAWMHLHHEVPEKKLREALAAFTGTITQLPPVKSAVKRQLRQRSIYYLNVLEIEGKEVLMRIGCQAGTYIRKICHDLGIRLKTGAHMAQLVRTKAGPFTDATWHSLQDVADAYAFWKEDGREQEIRRVIQPFEAAVSLLPKVWVMDSAVDAICHGAEVYVAGISKYTKNIMPEELVAIMTLKEELIGLGKAKMSDEEMMQLTKGVAVKTDAIFMERGTYPKHSIGKQ